MRLFVWAWLQASLCLTASALLMPALKPAHAHARNLDKRVPQQLGDFIPAPVDNHVDLPIKEDAIIVASSSTSPAPPTTTTTTHDPTTSTTASGPPTSTTPDLTTSTPNPTTTTPNPTTTSHPPTTSTAPASSTPPPTTTTTTTQSDPTTTSSPAPPPTTTTTTTESPPPSTTTTPPPTTTTPPPTTSTSSSDPSPPSSSTPNPVTTTTTPNPVTPTTTTPSPETSANVTPATSSSPTPTPITSAKVTSFTSHIGTGTDVTIIVSTAMVTVNPTDPALLTGGNSGGSSGTNNAAIIGGVIGGVGGAVLLGGLGVFMYKKHQRNKEFNEPYAAYDDDPDMSEYAPVTPRPFGSVGQQEGSDGGSYSPYAGPPPPLGNVTQQATPGNYQPGGDNQAASYGQYNNQPPVGHVGDGAGPYAGDYGQYQGPAGYLAPGDYRHSLSTGGSQENDTAADRSLPSSPRDSQNWGPGGHYRGPSDLPYGLTYAPNAVAAPADQVVAASVPGNKPHTRD